MSLQSSSHFASAIASGTDWRDTSKKVLEKLESAQIQKEDLTIGFLYISDILANDAGSILNLFRSVLKIDHWVGSVGMGVCGSGEEFIDAPAISAMVGCIPKDDFCIFPPSKPDDNSAEKALRPWRAKNDPMLVLLHGDPGIQDNPDRTLQALEAQTGGFLVGGLSSARAQHVQIADKIVEKGFSGVAFSQNIEVVTALSQGCKPIGPLHTITRGADNMISELDDQPASKVFEQDIRTLIIKKIDVDPDRIEVSEESLHSPEALPGEFQGLLKGEIDIAFPIAQSDRNDYLVRNIIGMDPDEGTISLADVVKQGESVLFVHRDAETIKQDLTQSLLKLRERVIRQSGNFVPKGALYISCVARAFADFKNAGDPAPGGEMALVRDIIGEVPLAGFYGSSEISNARFYGYTGILILFL